MTTENVCPFCGGPLENLTGTECPSCGSALPASATSAATIISPRSAFNSSAEVMDEVKKLASAGDSSAATVIASREFGLNQEAARQTVEQVEFEIQHDGRASSQQEYSASHPEVIDAPTYETPKKPSNNRNLVVGGSLGAVIFLCCCCCLPLLFWIIQMRGK